MAAKVTFRMDPTLEAQVMASVWLRELMERLTLEVSDAARRLAPRLLGFVIESIDYEVGREGAMGRLVGRVSAGDFKAAWHEFGTRNMHPHPFLRPALAQVLPGATITGGRARPEYR